MTRTMNFEFKERLYYLATAQFIICTVVLAYVKANRFHQEKPLTILYYNSMSKVEDVLVIKQNESFNSHPVRFEYQGCKVPAYGICALNAL